jgi:hypothetical protein
MSINFLFLCIIIIIMTTNSPLDRILSQYSPVQSLIKYFPKIISLLRIFLLSVDLPSCQRTYEAESTMLFP